MCCCCMLDGGRGSARVHPKDAAAKSAEETIPDLGLRSNGAGVAWPQACAPGVARDFLGAGALIRRVPLRAANITLPRKKGWALVESWWVIDPRKAGWVAAWDLATTLALIFTAVVTPVEVAFIEPPATMEERLKAPLFLMNRAIDLVFICDIALQFRFAYKAEDVHGSSWVMQADKIAINYFTTMWFPLDLFSTLTSIFDFIESENGNEVSNLTAFRAVCTLRLLELTLTLTPHPHPHPHTSPPPPHPHPHPQPSKMRIVGAPVHFHYGVCAGDAGCFRARLFHASVAPHRDSGAHLKVSTCTCA